MASDNSSIVKAFLVELSSGSLDRALSYLTEDATWGIAQVARGVTISKHQLKDRLMAMRASFKNNTMQLKPINIIEGDGALAVELEGLAETNLDKMYTNKYCLIFKMANEKIASVREYNDSVHVTEVLLPAMQYTMAQAAQNGTSR
jgi:ketosteroid isomerase-like protein